MINSMLLICEARVRTMQRRNFCSLLKVAASFSLKAFVEDQIGPTGMRVVINGLASMGGMAILSKGIMSMGTSLKDAGLSHSKAIELAGLSHSKAIELAGLSHSKSIESAGKAISAGLDHDKGLRFAALLLAAAAIAVALINKKNI
jgi:hypothetical protein